MHVMRLSAMVLLVLNARTLGYIETGIERWRKK